MGIEQRYDRVRRYIESLDEIEGAENRMKLMSSAILAPHLRVPTATPTDSTGFTYIIDLGQEGNRMFQQVYDFVDTVADYRIGRIVAARMIFETMVNRVVRELNRPPAEAVEHLQYFPHRSDIVDLFRMIKLHEPDVFSNLFNGTGLLLYKKIRSQLVVKLNVQYAAANVGRDFVLIREVVFPTPGRMG